MMTSQNMPVVPGKQVHAYDVADVATQFALFLQGLDEQKFILFSQYVPL
jgi:hypothetical protein